jgi:ribosome-associated protein
MRPTTEARIERALAQARWQAVRAQGPGGQNVNAVATAVHLSLELAETDLPAAWLRRLQALSDRRVGRGGRIVIKAQAHRSQAMNRRDAFTELAQLLRRCAHAPKPRIASRPPAGSRRRRLEAKKQRGARKRLRRRPADDH